MPEFKGTPTMEIVHPGILTTVQDRGRFGYQSLGIAESGAMDTFALVAANRLVGNSDDSAGLEITLSGPKIRFLAETWASLTGADLSARLNNRPLRPGAIFRAGVNDLLAFGPRVYGMRAYLALEGGIDVPFVLGSRSTYLYAGFGGHEGRMLQKGDILSAVGPARSKGPAEKDLPHDFKMQKSSPFLIRVIIGPHEDRFTDEGLKAFLTCTYLLTSESNRMGYRLKGPRITHRNGPIVVSESTPLGAIQVPGQGNPVILLRERGTTGGYAKIGCVITRDLDILAQIFPGEEIHFTQVDVETAHALDRDRWKALDDWRSSQKND
jgi:antagonist of KipI